MLLRYLRRVAAMLCVCILAAAAPVSAKWHRASNGHFTIYGDMSATALKRYADRLEGFDAAMRYLTKAGESRPVTIYLVRDEDVERLAGNASVGGFYSPSAQEAYIVAPLRTERYLDEIGFDATTVLQHEYAHHMLLSNVDQFLPAWAGEGMAEFFSTAELKSDGRVVLGAPPQIRGFALLGGHRWSARELLLSETRAVEKAELDQRYAGGWLLVHYLLLGGERPNQYAQYIAALNAGGSVSDAAEQVFGDLGELDFDLTRHLRRRAFQAVEVGPDQLPALQPVTVEPLSVGAAAMMPHRVRSAIGVTGETAGPLADSAALVAARYPEDPLVQRAFAEMQYDAGRYAEAIAAADRALQADAGNVIAMTYRGRALAQLARAEGREDLWRDARSWFLRANHADPNHPQPFVSYYDSFIAAGEAPVEAARNGLLRAIVLAPQDPFLRPRVAHLLLEDGDLAAARMMLGAVAFDPHAAEDNPARIAVRLIDEGSSAEAVLTQVSEDLAADEYADELVVQGQDQRKGS